MLFVCVFDLKISGACSMLSVHLCFLVYIWCETRASLFTRILKVLIQASLIMDEMKSKFEVT